MKTNDRHYGWNCKLLNVDLSGRKVENQRIDPSVLEAYLGGRGLNMWILHQNLSASIDPFSMKNLLVFGAGPLVGTVIPANGRFNVSSRSPLTSLLGDSNSAGYWAPPLRKVGYDGIIVGGKADHPVYLLISDECSEIRDASFLWGKTVSETDYLLREKHGKNSQVLSIGPAGEKQVRFSAVLNNVDRAAGRTGNGAVMGSKKLKAIVVLGKGKIPVADPEKVHAVAKEIRAAMRASQSFEARSQYGTPILVQLYNHMSVLPTNNHQRGTFQGASGCPNGLAENGSKMSMWYALKREQRNYTSYAQRIDNIFNRKKIYGLQCHLIAIRIFNSDICEFCTFFSLAGLYIPP